MTAPPPSASLADWLAYLELLHPKGIALGLDRVEEVRDRMGLRLACPVITVGGTNGKGSTAAMLERILNCAGYRVGCYTSPHLLRFNERVRYRCEQVADAELVVAFREVERARLDTSLTYFEFSTLAAVQLFVSRGTDVAVLEVGLGGRLDAVNVFDPDCAVVTNVALDHQDYLGSTREEIGREKAGIFRKGKPAICADPDPPRSVCAAAVTIGADLRLIGRDFGFDADERQLDWWGRDGKRHGLAHPALRGANQLVNAATVLAALESVAALLPVGMQEIRDGFATVMLPGRFQVLPGRPVVVLDVAHNPHAAAVFAANLGSQGFFGRTIAVFGMLSDKDIGGVVEALRERVDAWHCASLPGPRGTTGDRLERIVAAAGGSEVHRHPDVVSAYRSACGEARENDRIIVFGSFFTVAEVAQLQRAPRVRASREHGR